MKLVLRVMALGAALYAGASPNVARADDAPPTAVATCERAAGPGRVRCDAEVSVTGASLRWVDVVIVETPSFVQALKGRVGPADATSREDGKWKLSFGLVARDRGTGDAKLRVRAVVCRGERCEPALLNVPVTVVAGS